MLEASFERVLAFHRELVALSAAGLPIAQDLGRSHREIVSRLERINASLTLRTELGQPIEQAIIEDGNLPPRYRDRLLVWLRCDRPSVVMNSLSRPMIASLDVKREISIVLMQLMVIMGLIYFAFIVLCLWTNPQITAIYAQLERSPNWISSWLSTLSDWLPIWSVALPLLFGFLLLLWRSQVDEGEWAWLPGAADYFTAIRNANFSQHLAELLDSGLPLAEGLPLAMSLSETPLPISEKVSSDLGRESPTDTVPIEALPPTLPWALDEASHGESMSVALRFSAAAYRKLAQRLRRIWLLWIPAIISTLFAGVLVLVYGLSVFLPLIWLLHDLSISGN